MTARLLSLGTCVFLSVLAFANVAVAEETSPATNSTAHTTASDTSPATSETAQPSNTTSTPGKTEAPPATHPPSPAPCDAAGCYPDECHAKFESLRADMEALNSEHMDKRRAFHENFAKARGEFFAADHTEEETRAFHLQWMHEGHALALAHHAAVRALMESRLGECFRPEMAPPPPPEPQMPAEDHHYGDLPPPPKDGRYQLDEEGDRIRLECEAQGRALFEEYQRNHQQRPTQYGTREMQPPPDGASRYQYNGEYGGQPPMAGQAPPPPPEYGDTTYREPYHGDEMPPPMKDMPAELKEKLMQLMRDCEARIRAHFQAKHGDGPEDFKKRFNTLEMYWDADLGRMVVKGKYLALQGEPESQLMEKITCAGQLILDSLAVDGLLANFHPEKTGSGTALMIDDSNDDRVVSYHDNPRCVTNVWVTDEIPSVTLDLADYFDVTEAESGDLRFSDGKTEGKILLHGAEYERADGNVVTITSKHATLIVKAGGGGDEELDEAVAGKKVLAEVAVAQGEDGLDVDNVPIGDGEVKVEGEKDRVVATIDSTSLAGQVVVLDLDKELFSGEELKFEVVEVHEDGSEEPLEALEADDMEDVLAPEKADGQCIEYWIVEDKHGFKALLGICHFSTKKFTITSADAKSASVPGFEAVVLMAAVGLVALLAVFRRRDEP